MSIPLSFRHLVRTSAPAAAILLQALAVQAQEFIPPEAIIPEPGLSYAVRDVAANDSLNVRSQPGARSEMLMRLPHDARGIRVTGRWMAEGPSVWWEVITTGGQATTGWVNHRYLAAEPGEAQSTYPLQCAGTEPFWSLRLDDRHAAYSSPETELLTLSASSWIRSRNSPGVFAIQLSSDGDGLSGNGYATIDRTACSDGMSGFEYPFEATVIMPDQTVLDGCCSRLATP
jgi:uncharacterized membrane protein